MLCEAIKTVTTSGKPTGRRISVTDDAEGRIALRRSVGVAADLNIHRFFQVGAFPANLPVFLSIVRNMPSMVGFAVFILSFVEKPVVSTALFSASLRIIPKLSSADLSAHSRGSPPTCGIYIFRDL